MLQMKAAYISAEREIINEANKGNDLTGWDKQPDVLTEFGPMSAEEFHNFEVDGFGNIKNISAGDMLLDRAREVRKKLDIAIQDENYVKASMLQNVLNGIEIEYKKLKDE